MTSIIQQHISVPAMAQHPDEIATAFGIVRKGMEAWGHDGKIGRIVLIVRDRYTHEPSHLVVQRGWFWNRRMLIPLHWAINIVDNRMSLNLRQAQLERLAEYRCDIQIAREVHRAVYTSSTFMPGGDCATICVLVQNGVVTLRGNVRDHARRFEAQAMVNRIQGVFEVRNELVADDDLRRRVEQEIARDAALASLDLSVTVNLGLVEICGRVPSAPSYDRLLVLVRQVSGSRAIWANVVVETASDRCLQGVGSVPTPQVV